MKISKTFIGASWAIFIWFIDKFSLRPQSLIGKMMPVYGHLSNFKDLDVLSHLSPYTLASGITSGGCQVVALMFSCLGL